MRITDSITLHSFVNKFIISAWETMYYSFFCYVVVGSITTTIFFTKPK